MASSVGNLPVVPYNMPFHYTLSLTIIVPGSGNLQKGAKFVIIISHEEHVLHGG